MIIGRYAIFSTAAKIHRIINTTSFAAYARAYDGLLSIVRHEAEKLVAIETVLMIRLAVPHAFNIK